eukprot:s1030_g2.t1
MTVMRVAGVALLGFFLPTLAAQEECDDSAYIQRQADPVAPMTPAVPAVSFMEVLTSAAPTPLTCGVDMYPFGGEETNDPQCTTVTPSSPFSSSCTYEQFNTADFDSTCWWPFQAGTDYCVDTFDKKASNQVTLEGFMTRALDTLRQRVVSANDKVSLVSGDSKTACFTSMPTQLSPKYVCVSAGGTFGGYLNILLNAAPAQAILAAMEPAEEVEHRIRVQELLQFAHSVLVTITKEKEFEPWRYGSARMTEISIEEHFGMLRRQSGNSQLTCRAFWQAAARVSVKVGQKLNEEQAAATNNSQEPLTKDEFLGVFYQN